MKTSDVLNVAADEIEARGWRRTGGWNTGRQTERLCLEGGIMAAIGLRFADTEHPDEDVNEETGVDRYREFRSCPAYLAVLDYLGDRMPSSLFGDRRLYVWNDEPLRTREDVIEVLRAAAEVEHTKEQAAALAVA